MPSAGCRRVARRRVQKLHGQKLEQQRQQQRETAITGLQAQQRSRSQRKSYERWRWAAAKIQSAWRGVKGRADAGERLQDIIWQAYTAEQSRKAAAAHHEKQMRRAERRSQQGQAATRLQAAQRGKVGRARAAATREDMERRATAEAPAKLRGGAPLLLIAGAAAVEIYA